MNYYNFFVLTKWKKKKKKKTCRDTFLVPKPKMYGISAQWAKYNKFIESESKNKALMSWTPASIELNDNQTQTRDSNISGLSIRGGWTCINWAQ